MKLSLHQMTLGNGSPERTLELAAACGFDCVDLFLRTPVDLPYDFQYVETPSHAGELRRKLDDNGLAVHNVDTFIITPDKRPQDFESVLEMAQILGASVINTVVFDPDRPAALQQLAEFAGLAKGYGVRPVIEWFKFSELTSLPAALAFLNDAGSTGAGLNADILHLMRNGGSIEDIKNLDPGLIGYAQASDGPLVQAEEREFEEATANRMIPGDGEFNLAGFVAALPADGVLALECPTLHEAGDDSQAQRIRRASEAMHRLLETAEGVAN